ncbi:putative Gnk2-like domain-containing protein [Helianthus annuus]|nr:putative Gnk2-like domain-containing protein [Helianthus annuus]
MSDLTGKALLLFCFVFMYLINFLINAQPQYPFFICHNDTTYTPNTNYSRNLDAALSFLPTTNSGFGYFNSSAGQGTDTANAICLCRGDVELNMCQSCLRDAVFRLRVVCPNQREAVIYYELCLLKYSNAPILGNTDMNRDLYYLTNNNNFTDKELIEGVLKPFMNNLRSKAATGTSLLKFAMEDTSAPNSTTLYGLTQCIPSLSEPQCNDCLEIAINRLSSCCDGRVGAVVLMARCNIRYETYEFYINPAILPPPSSRPSPRSPPGTYVVSPI